MLEKIDQKTEMNQGDEYVSLIERNILYKAADSVFSPNCNGGREDTLIIEVNGNRKSDYMKRTDIAHHISYLNTVAAVSLKLHCTPLEH